MSSIIPSAPIVSMTGRIFGENSRTSLRVLFGKEHAYHYVHKPDSWSDAQINHRLFFGAAAYYARIIRKNPEAETYYLALFRKQKRYHRLDNFLASVISSAMKTDEAVRTAAFAAHEEHMRLRLKFEEHDAAIARQTEEAKLLWETHLKADSTV